MTKRQSYVLSPPKTADDGKIASGGMKWKKRNQLTMEDLEDDDVADEHFRPPKGGESSSSEDEDEDEEVEEETPPKRNKVKILLGISKSRCRLRSICITVVIRYCATVGE